MNNSVCTGKMYDVPENDVAAHSCKYCKRTFTCSTNMYRHVNHTCKIKKGEDQQHDQMHEKLIKLEEKSKKIDELEETNLKLMEKSKKIDEIEENNRKLKNSITLLEKTINSIKNVEISKNEHTPTSSKQQRKVSEATKKLVVGKQFYKCANNPLADLNNLENYVCPLWTKSDKKIRGNFDECGYEIDHIQEFSVTGNDNIDNLQALCKNCHSVKTRTFLRSMTKKVKAKKDHDEDQT